MSGVCDMHRKDKFMHFTVNLKRRDHLEYLGVHGMIILKGS
jgi:hypothetical protein